MKLKNSNNSNISNRTKHKPSEALFEYYQLERLSFLKSLCVLKTHVQTQKCILNFIFMFEHIFFINSDITINKKNILITSIKRLVFPFL